MKALAKFFGYLFGIGAMFFVLVAAAVWIYISDLSKDLPEYDALREYEPPVMTRVHAVDGSLMAEYARERRLFLPIQAVPNLVINAFLSAEDKTFYQHYGIDPSGIVRAIVVNFRNRGGDRRPVGASTITQQVAKNFLLSNEISYERKIKEMIIALRMEQAFAKDQILELYLNEIYLGLGAYGIAAAALVYFDKSVHELTLAEAAYLAALPKGPNNYHPFRFTEVAIERRNWVLQRMVEDGFVSSADAEAAKAEPLDVTPRGTGTRLFASEYFSEEVRRQVADIYGEKRLYEGGLSVRSTLDPRLQREARKALMNGLVNFDVARGRWRGPVAKIAIDGDWGPPLNEVEPLSDLPDWRLAVVLSVDDDGALVGLRPERNVDGSLPTDRQRLRVPLDTMRWRVNGRLPARASDLLAPGDVVYTQLRGGDAAMLRQVPEISGAIVAMDPHTGRVLAMVGGFSFAQSEFNRATQARRQPGSSFKPFVYAAALDNGYTPSSVIMDAPFELAIPGQPLWRPSNYSGEYYGPTTLRTGIELSRNVMTVRLAADMGMPLVVEYAKRFGLYDDLPAYLPMALGAGETTVLRMVTAYSIVANGGRKITPTLIDRIQDRHGRTIYKHDERVCNECNAVIWRDQPEPTVDDDSLQVLDPMTAYQVTSMMEGVVQRGTATRVRVLGRPVAGKTGTTNEEKDAWFIGFTPDLAVGVFIGYDTPRPMGRGATGGQVAAPVFVEFMQAALIGVPPVEFRVPPGLQLIAIDKRTGMRSVAGGPGTIIEAFKPGMEPPTSMSVIGYGDALGEARAVSPEAERAIFSGTGGLY